jgi:hypothetical protein
MSQIYSDSLNGANYDTSNYSTIANYYQTSPPIMTGVPISYFNKADKIREVKMLPVRSKIPFRSAYDTLSGFDSDTGYSYFDLNQAYKSR